MPYTYTCTSCGATAQTTRAADLRNRSGRRCQDCKSSKDTTPRHVETGTPTAAPITSRAVLK